jgi:tetratricopeptide (TPR) repeat protein
MRAVPQLWHFRRHWVMTCAAGLFLIVMTCVAWSQTRQWHDSRTLWTHTADVTADNEVAENNLGILLQQDGRIDEAISHYQRAIAIQTQRGHARYRTTLALSRNNLGNAWFRKGEIDQAIAQYRAAVALRPDYADAFYNLGIALLEKGELDGAIGSLETALSLRPADAAVHVRLGDALRRKRADAEALVHYQKALELEPTALWAHDSLAWLLATCSDSSIRNGARSLEIARDALRLPGGDNALTLRTLAAAYATQGDFGAAVHAAERGLHFALAQRDIAILQSLQSDLELYRGNVPLREISPVE